jgi:CRP-like cAMP-binding protein
MAIFSSLKDNYLLGALTPSDCTHFRKDLELVELQSQQYLDEPNMPLSHVFFPTSCIVSLMCLTEDGTAVESAVVGREGVIGTAFFMGGGPSPVRAMVQRTGFAYRIKASLFKREFDRNLGIQRASFRYTQALLTQLAQSVLCNRCHSVDQHLCRWLLDSLDRMSSNELTATHESIANMLGVRRESVTAAAGKLKNAGLISSQRGHIRVLDRHALEARACECYQIVKREFQGLLTLNDAPQQDRTAVRAVVTRRIDKSAAAYRHPPVNSSSAAFSRASSL